MFGKGKNEIVINFTLIAISVFFVCGIGELILRQFFAKELIVLQEERALLYRYDELLGWFPRANSTNTFSGSRTITVTHNSRGFRDIEHVKNDRQGMLFLGDSFVWGFDVEQIERFTEKLRPRMIGWEIYNLGVSGYGTDQEYLLLQQHFDYYTPELVVLIFCTDNDDNDNISNSISNGSYFKPYFEVYGDHNLDLRGVPVPKSLTYFARQHTFLAKSYVVRLFIKALSPKTIRNENVFPPSAAILKEMNDFVLQRQSRLVVGLTERQPALENFMKSQNIPYIQLAGAERYSTNFYHWTPKGHTTVSNRIYDYLVNAGLVSLERKGLQ